VRTTAPLKEEEPPKEPKDDVQAALAVIKRRNDGFDTHALDLRSTALRGAKLPDADLRGVKLAGANLEGANLDGADIADADFEGAVNSREAIKRAKNADLAKNKPTDGDEAAPTPC
jgi:uncharacterized protein YjbI with pentapeptide repeats